MSEHKGTLGIAQGTALYIASVLGTGILVLPGLAAQVAGPGSILSVAIIFVLSIPLAGTFAALAARYPDSGGVASYSFVGDNEVVFNTFDKPFDGVMMMDCSQCPIHPKLQPIFYEFSKKHSDTVRKYGAEPILFMSWAYADKPDMTMPLANEYIKAGKLNNALVVPAGLAFANSIAQRPDLNLYVADKRHPSLMGTYLAASTVMASVYKQNPIGNTYTAGLPKEVAAHLQKVAWDTVQTFQAKEGRGSL